MKITWYGTAAIKLEENGEVILIDPFSRINPKLERPSMDEFGDADIILNTHPHLDHLYHAPSVLKRTNAKIYGSKMMRDTLKRRGVNIDKKIKIVSDYDVIKTRETSIIVYPAKHCENDILTSAKVLARAIFTFQLGRALTIEAVHKKFPLGEDVFAYKIKTEEKNILVFGSAGVSENMSLLEPIDILIWPYQGREDMAEYSLEMIQKINPRTVILSHFDDAFPPVTVAMDTKRFVDLMRKLRPDIKVIIPKYGKSMKF
ncbi:MAG: MBL fold metallo-hydrolase [Lachnospiraceae bacterium]